MTNTTTLHTGPVDGGPFACRPAMSHEIEDESILTNDVTFPWERGPLPPALYILGHEFGAVCAVWATCEQDAWDEACDAGLLACFEAEDEAEDEGEDLTRLGNESRPHDLTYGWALLADLSKASPQTLCRFAEARGAGADTLAEV